MGRSEFRGERVIVKENDMAMIKAKARRGAAKKASSANGAAAGAATIDVLTLAEAAEYLRVPEGDVLNMVKTQGLAGRQIGTQWRFLRSSLQDWLKGATQKSSKESFLALSGVWKDDPYVDEMLDEIYKKRGRPMTEEKA
jgi:excisionase family DNA binding protein